MSAFLDLYEPLDVIGNGSFGIIRKVKRKSDGLVFARKELNFERMSERDRKQIVAEVNILKDLNHEHIVGYHDRYVDRDAGILYILMEYCGGGDLSGIIKQAGKHNRPISEDTIWNYFMQILLALHHCHHPNGHGRSNSGSGSSLTDGETGGTSRRPQILHRDLKPDNVFLDETNNVKLGDFGLSKALAQSSFANTYVGTPYYMSPELMQEKAYDSKSDIWSLGCLIYELCALKPPFHEAKTHSELSILIRNGRIPPLPRGYSQALFGVIKAMLNLNPAMRPSAAQLLQHERLELVLRVSETEKMLSQLKLHKNTIVQREREVAQREQQLTQQEHEIQNLIASKDRDVAHLQQLVAQLQHQQASLQQISQREVSSAVKHAVARREEELRVLVTKREEEVAAAMAKREEEIMAAVRRREAEVCEAWVQREAEVRLEVETSIRAVQERVVWIAKKEEELRDEEARLESVTEELEMKTRKLEEVELAKGRQTKTPLEEVKNTLGPVLRRLHETPTSRRAKHTNDTQATPKAMIPHPFPSALETPITRPAYTDSLPSAMRGVVFTTTGEVLATPNPNELSNLFSSSPKVGLDFSKIFESSGSSGSGCGEERDGDGNEEDDEESVGSPPPSPTRRKEVERRRERLRTPPPPSRPQVPASSSSSALVDDESDNPTITISLVGLQAGGAQQQGSQQPGAPPPPPTRIRRPSIRSGHRRSSSIPASASLDSAIVPSSSSAGSNPQSSNSSTATSSCSSSSAASSTSTSASSSHQNNNNNTTIQAKPLPHPHLPTITRSTSVPCVTTTKTTAMGAAAGTMISTPRLEYDFSDQENLPSPFLKKGVRMGVYAASTAGGGGGGGSSSSSSASSSSSSGGSLRATSTTTSTKKKRPSTGNLLRAVAAANSAGRARKGSGVGGDGSVGSTGSAAVVVVEAAAGARKAGEEVRKAVVSRP